MVLLAAAVCTKQGKALVSRQFVEMTRARIEGLLAAFPKLMSSGIQHTFVETESVRYVYQPMERLYMLLITTKTSNILEDLETLRLFSRVIPEYCRTLDEQDVLDNVFDLIFAFDEIVALGYRESVNLAQIRTFTEMESHEEKVYEAMRKSQEKEAHDAMKRRAKELQLAKKEARKAGRTYSGGGFGGGGGGGGGGYGGHATPMVESLPSEPAKSSYKAPSRPRTGGSAMVLGRKGKDVETFVHQLKAEGEKVTSATAARQPSAVTSKPAAVQQSSVHLRLTEKMSLVAGRDGGLQSMEVLGLVTLRITDAELGRVQVAISNQDPRPIQFQTHPNVDKALFNQRGILGLKQSGKSFPLHQDIGALKWRLQTSDETLMPLSINCWPSENAGKCDVNIEYELLQEYLELTDVIITIPIPSGVGAPVVGELVGEHHYDSKKHVLDWRLPVIDASNSSGSLEFSIAGMAGDFFPIRVCFVSTKPYCKMEVTNVTLVESGQSVKFSSEVLFSPDKFEIV